MRKLISSGSPFEAQAGYSRAVAAGDWCFVAGTTGRDPATGHVPPDVEAQTELAFEIVERALVEAGFTLAHVVRTTYYVTQIEDFHRIAPILGRRFAGIRPAATMVEVSALVQPDMKIEIEVTAYRGG